MHKSLLAWMCTLPLVACSSADREGTTQTGPIDVPAAVIDTGATLADVEPGKGVGVFVEYTSGGNWRVSTACDTEVSGAGCVWDVIVSTSGELRDLEGEALEVEDYLDRDGPGSARLVTYTTRGTDGLTFRTDPGEAIRLDVVLDDIAEGRFIYWVGGGAVHNGAPTSIIDLLPTEP